ncbi:S-adenosyl-L-methionine-dependent methyltransferase [Apiosordaria backusii]|uniref:DNA (cytosine-5-)-methyltransferase n=1 Tax=Apiosordaria backusii TaxID=314023 RepID=A0AA40AXL4_9PEZI|nr:S-adenosyl-L-methionine-dependent methyltransferase [Apiosordaria backusii]
MRLQPWRWGNLPISWQVTPFRSLYQHHENHDASSCLGGVFSGKRLLRALTASSQAIEARQPGFQGQTADSLSRPPAFWTVSPVPCLSRQENPFLSSTLSLNSVLHHPAILRLGHSFPHQLPNGWLHPAKPHLHHLHLIHHYTAKSSPRDLVFHKPLLLQLYEKHRHHRSPSDCRYTSFRNPFSSLSSSRSLDHSPKMADIYDPSTHSQLFSIDDDESDIQSLNNIKHELEDGQRFAASLINNSIEDDVYEVDEFGQAVNPFEALDQEYQVEDQLARDLIEIIDLTEDGVIPAGPASRSSSPGEEQALPEWTLEDGLVLTPHMTIELRPTGEENAIQFLRILSIVRITKDGRSNTVLRGWGFVRSRKLHGCLPRKLNEVCLVAKMKTTDHRGWREQALIDIDPSRVMLIRNLRITNAEFPDFRFDSEDYHLLGKEEIKECGPLVCRWRYESYYQPGKKTACEWTYTRLLEDDVEEEYKVKDSQMTNRWRGGIVPGGSHIPHADSPGMVVDLEDANSDGPPMLKPGQRYTAADIFAGAGGASRGIERSGCRLLFSLDHWEPAADSLRRNFPGTHIYQKDVTDFVTDELPAEHSYPDILHLSPPCQFWSPAHTVAGRDDEKNVAVLFSCTDLIQKLRPRVFTVEQTFGLVHDRFRLYFNTFIQGFTRHGYSLRYKVLHLNQYGLAQTRKRLVIIGAGPGEKLPPFPPPTHSKTPELDGLKPCVTPKEALSIINEIKDSHPLHDLTKVVRYNPPKPRWDPRKPVNTITCSGGQNYHWRGLRQFTDLEYAVLQGFPMWHRFSEFHVKKQIGNAFAPSVVRVLYEHIVRFLQQQDKVQKLALPSPEGGLSPIDVPDSDDERDQLEYLGRGIGTKDQPMELDDDDDDEVECLSVSASGSGWSSGTEGRPGRHWGDVEVIDLDGGGGRNDKQLHGYGGGAYIHVDDGWEEYREEDFMELDEAGTEGDPIVVDLEGGPYWVGR